MTAIDCFYKVYEAFTSLRARVRWYLRIDPADPIDVDGVMIRIPFARAGVVPRPSVNDTETTGESFDSSNQESVIDISFDMRWFVRNHGTEYDTFIEHLGETRITWIEYIKVMPDNTMETVRISETPPFNALIRD